MKRWATLRYFIRFIAVSPVVFPVFILTAFMFVIEEILQVKNGPTVFLDKWILDPLNNFIDTGVLKCS